MRGKFATYHYNLHMCRARMENLTAVAKVTKGSQA